MVVFATITALLFSLPDLYKCIFVLLGCALSGNITKTIKNEGNKDHSEFYGQIWFGKYSVANLEIK